MEGKKLCNSGPFQPKIVRLAIVNLMAFFLTFINSDTTCCNTDEFYKDAEQGGHPPSPVVYLVPLTQSRAHCAASQTDIESGRFGVLSRGVLGPVGAFFVRVRALFAETPRIELVQNRGPQLTVS